MKKVALILPTYNEADNIEALIIELEEIFEKLEKYDLILLVIDDYSPDGTAEIVNKLALKYKNIILKQKQKEGLGAAYVFGMNYAVQQLNADFLIQMDADWSHNPRLLPDFFKKIESGADVVIGSRYIQGGSIPGNWGIHRKIFSVVGNTIVRFGLGMKNPHDWTSGYRLMRSKVFKQAQHGLEKYSGYTFQIAFLHRIKVHGFSIAEVPLQFVDRTKGKSKIAPFDYIKNVLMYVFNHSTLIKYLIIGCVGFTVQTVIAQVLVWAQIFPGLAVGIGSFFAIVTNFMGNNLWTFSHKKIVGLKKLLHKFIHFVMTSIGAVIIQALVVGAGVILLGQQAWFWLMVFAIVFLVIPYNYFIYNRFIWKTSKT